MTCNTNTGGIMPEDDRDLTVLRAVISTIVFCGVVAIPAAVFAIVFAVTMKDADMDASTCTPCDCVLEASR